MNKSAGHKILREAFKLDRRGNEAAAIPLYRKALRLGSNKNEQRDATICLASSLRTAGRPKAALATLRRANRLFPHDSVIQLFTTLVYHDLGRHSASLRLLAMAYLQPSRDRKLAPYRPVRIRKFRGL